MNPSSSGPSLTSESAPLDHVLRFEPPWRASRKTECGRRADDVGSVIDRDALVAKVKAQGQQRASFTTCMTCWERTKYAQPWDHSPSSVLNRESNRYAWGRRGDSELDQEMRALTLLWESHRDEFDEVMRGLGEVNDLSEKRATKRRRA